MACFLFMGKIFKPFFSPFISLFRVSLLLEIKLFRFLMPILFSYLKLDLYQAILINKKLSQINKYSFFNSFNFSRRISLFSSPSRCKSRNSSSRFTKIPSISIDKIHYKSFKRLRCFS
jgi:hypothetical protein